MFKIGFSFGYHDSSVSVSQGLKLIGIYSEERFSRVKHDNRFPEKALAHAVKVHNINKDNISCCVYYENPIAKASRIKRQHETLDDYERYINANYTTKYYKLDPIKSISNELGISESKVFFTDHHASHVFTALSLAPESLRLNEAELISLTLDGVGEYTTGTLSSLRALDTHDSFPDLGRFAFPNSLGLFYSVITSFLGFEVNDAEYKVMGLAAYGQPNFFEELKDFIL